MATVVLVELDASASDVFNYSGDQNADLFIAIDDVSGNISVGRKTTANGFETISELQDNSAAIGGGAFADGLVAGADTDKSTALELVAGRNIVSTATGTDKSVKFQQDGSLVKVGSFVEIINLGTGQTLTVYVNNTDQTTGTIADDTAAIYKVEAGVGDDEYTLTRVYSFAVGA